MAFVDELTIYAKAGDGGDGVVRWLHLKYEEFSGPAGGNGGKGGDVYAVAVRDTALLSRYRANTRFTAPSGEPGGSKGLHGAHGADMDIAVPIGSIITNLDTKMEYELTHEGERVLLLKGGRGGRGNKSFKGPTNRAPQEATPGKKGEAASFRIELRLIADAGLVGFPNAGKSTLLNKLTRADAKTGAYPFTTLSPHLGDMYGYIVADIPGLIEGASTGKGLGHTFLRHIARTRLLVHLVSLEHEDPYAAYQSIRSELAAYDKALLEKPEVVILSKRDTVTPEACDMVKELFAQKGHTILVFSAYDDTDTKEVRDELVRMLGFTSD